MSNNEIKQSENLHNFSCLSCYDHIYDLTIKIEEREEFITKLQAFFRKKLDIEYVNLYSEFMQKFIKLEKFNIDIDKNNFTYSDYVDDLYLKIEEAEYFISEFEMFFYDNLGIEYMNLFSEFMEEENERIKNELISFYENEISDLNIENLEIMYLNIPSNDN
ncbi:8040_t:CDS:1 [Scutellospora calospora]|uniref:8040_t:CDS:1 n=1 Tax=Scutellospora calospora TaxID=85575 RepID=A0ACA9KGD0_9GLOM|nr:8040_t:CDS:1 [Scutellospora calospora]